MTGAPTHPQKKIIHLCIILWILVQSYTVSVLILFGGHCDLYIMVQRFCLVSLTISNIKTSYRSLKQTAGSTSCPWTTILVVSTNDFLYCLRVILHVLNVLVFILFPFNIIIVAGPRSAIGRAPDS